ncbi:hypothetical protein HI914_05337 [Erysiphe necator]|nr:hypothetical protein HI914_05337 [Erysiphe necator]
MHSVKTNKIHVGYDVKALVILFIEKYNLLITIDPKKLFIVQTGSTTTYYLLIHLGPRNYSVTLYQSRTLRMNSS